MFVEEIYHIEKKLNIHFDGHNSSTNEPFIKRYKYILISQDMDII